MVAMMSCCLGVFFSISSVEGLELYHRPSVKKSSLCSHTFLCSVCDVMGELLEETQWAHISF